MRTTVGTGNLPRELTSFVGRRRELADVQTLLSDSRLATLVGPGGVGKTRLALRAAARMQPEFPDGVWLVELDPLREQALVAPTAARVFGLQGQAGLSSGEQLAAHLAERHALLVIDNCEHVSFAVARLAEVLLRDTRHLRILTTSRKPLGVDGETVLSVPPLPVPTAAPRMALDESALCDAVALFLDRACAVVPGFALAGSNRTAVGEICKELDGLPLAIELAAAWLPVLSPEQIRDRLGSRLSLLTRGPRAAVSRQQTLESCIAWSHDLCGPAERRLWARLSVFAGDFDVDAADSVCIDDRSAIDNLAVLLASLVDKSVLIRQEHATGMRYRMLESLRVYGADRLREAGEDTTIRRRHRDWFHGLTLQAETDWISPRLEGWRDRLDAELPNLRAALEFSLTEPGGGQAALEMIVASTLFWRLRGRHGEIRHWLDRALAQPGEPTLVHLKALWASVTITAALGDVDTSAESARQLRAVARSHGDAHGRAVAAYADALQLTARGDLALAVTYEEEALEAFRAHGDVLWEVMTLTSLTLTKVLLGDIVGAAGHHERMVARCRVHGASWPSGFTAMSLGIGLWKQGDLERAAELTRQALPLLRPSTLNTCWCLEVMAWIAAGRGRLQRAAVLLGAAEALAQAMGTRAAMWPELLTYHGQIEQQTRQTLGEETFRTAFTWGESLPLDDAVAFALDDREGDRGEAPPDPAWAARPGGAIVPSTLTRREREVAALVAEGLTNKDIAARLVISPRTAEGHVQRIMSKLGCTSRTQLAALILDSRHS